MIADDVEIETSDPDAAVGSETDKDAQKAARKAAKDAATADVRPIWRWKQVPGLTVPGLPNRDLTRSEVETWVATKDAALVHHATGAWDIDEDHMNSLPAAVPVKGG